MGLGKFRNFQKEVWGGGSLDVPLEVLIIMPPQGAFCSGYVTNSILNFQLLCNNESITIPNSSFWFQKIEKSESKKDFLPTNRSSFPGKQIGIIFSWKSILLSSLTSARSYSYVKKLYFGWTIFSTTFSSTDPWGSLVDEKSHSPIRTRIFGMTKLMKNKNGKGFITKTISVIRKTKYV